MEDLYIGSSTSGIYHMYFLDGILKEVKHNTSFENCSYLCQNSKFIYHVVESSENELYPFGCIASLNKNTFNTINYKLPHGKGPTHINFDAKTNIIYAANYGNGSLTAFSVNSDGSVRKYGRKYFV